MGCAFNKEDNKIYDSEIKQKRNVRFTIKDLVSEKQSNFIDDYIILNPPLGQGTYGEVRQVKHRQTMQLRAVKIIKKDYTSPETQQQLINEVKILKSLDHPNVIKIYEFYQDPKRFYIVTELCQGGELFDYILEQGHFDEQKAAQIFRQIISTLMYCHQHNIVHRDLKPENLLLENKTSMSIKVIDFGTSCIIDKNKKMKGRQGTAYYIAPEVINFQYDEKCDIWSAGVILYILICGYPPFNGENDEEIMKNVQKGEYSFAQEEWNNVSQDAKDLIQNMLQLNIKKRYSAEQVMQHKWMKNNYKQKKGNIQQTSLALQNIKKFKFQEATYMFLVNYLTSKDEKQRLLEIFQQIDINGDGQLSKQELLDGFSHLSNTNTPIQEVEAIFDEIDRDGSGFIDYHEFVMAATNQQNLINKESLQTAFHMIDKDGSGSISVEELKYSFGNHIPAEMWMEIIQEADENGDGEVFYLNYKIQYNEFKNVMIRILDSKTND